MEESGKIELCSKCGDNEARPHGTPRWCQNCVTLNNKKNAEVKLVREHGRGFTAGAQAMRDMLAQRFRKTGSVKYSAVEVAGLISEQPVPRLD